MMWFALIAALLGMSALTIIQTPREWLKRPLPRFLLILFHAVGIVSILLILFAVYRMQDGGSFLKRYRSHLNRLLPSWSGRFPPEVPA